MENLIQTIAHAYQNPAEGDADRNGHTRLAILQERFNLSSLKVQKILVTAGVYEPVKENSSYYEITVLRKEGKSAAEIREITGFSNATISACFPYERTMYNADRDSVERGSNAERKRRQRDREERKRSHARDVLQNNIEDDVFWKILEEHNGQSFIRSDGERYVIRVRAEAFAEHKRQAEIVQQMHIYQCSGVTLAFSRDDVLSVLHNALELLAAEKPTEEIYFDRTPALPYTYPLLVFFGVIPGDQGRYTTKRVLPESAVCSCCGCRADYVVRTYADLIKIAADIEEEERSRWAPSERERVERMELSMGRTGWNVIALRDNAAIREFNQGGERKFCTLCAQTIRIALEDGELPRSSAPTDLTSLSYEAAKTCFDRDFENFPENVTYRDRFDRTYASDMGRRDIDSPIFFFRERDLEGVWHSFACYTIEFPGHMLFEAMEIHKLTRAGKYARGYTGTDYEFQSGIKMIHGDDANEEARKTHIGFLELIGKVRDALKNPSLEWREDSFISNGISIGHRRSMLRSTGEMKVAYVEGGLVQGREWTGGQHGYMIDGCIFTGEEVALMSSAYEGWKLQYRFADASDPPLRAGEYLMPVAIGEKELVDETSELLNLFASDGRFISEHDKQNFGILFEKIVLKKLKLYYRSNPLGYGKLAGMKVVKRLGWIEGTKRQVEQVKKIIRM